MVWFGWVVFYGISTSGSYLIPKTSLNTYIKYSWFGLVEFYGISAIVAYTMTYTLFTRKLKTYDLVWLGFKAYQPM